MKGRLGALAALAGFGLLLAAKQLLAVQMAWGLSLRPVSLPVLSVATSVAAVALLGYLARGRFLVGFLCLDALVSTLALADVLHVKALGDLTSIATVRYASQLTELGGTVQALLEPRHALLLLDLPFLALALISRRAGRRGAPSRRETALLCGVTAALVAHVSARFDWYENRTEGNSGVARRFGLAVYHVVDVGDQVVRWVSHRRPTRAELAGVMTALETRRGQAPGSLRGLAQGRNLIVIQVESLQAFALGMRVGGESVTPRLEALRAEALSVARFYQQTGVARTADADLLFHCSLFPAKAGAAYVEYATNTFRCLPSLLADNGYDTVALQGIRGEFWNLRTIYPRLGYRQFLSRENLVSDEVIHLGLSDASLFRQSLDELARRRQPFLAFLVTLTSHHPYPHGDPLPLGELQGTELGRYLSSVHYADRQIGAFLDGLRSRGLLDRSLVVLYGDHSGLAWTPELAQLLRADPDDPLAEFEATRSVPLLMRFPGGVPAAPLDELAGQLDLAPTLASALDVDASSAPFLGRELGGSHPRRVIFPGGAAVQDDLLYLPGSGMRADRCYDALSRSGLPLARCEKLAASARRELELSNLILETDLVAELPQPPRRPSPALQPGAERGLPVDRAPLGTAAAPGGR